MRFITELLEINLNKALSQKVHSHMPYLLLRLWMYAIQLDSESSFESVFTKTGHDRKCHSSTYSTDSCELHAYCVATISCLTTASGLTYFIMLIGNIFMPTGSDMYIFQAHAFGHWLELILLVNSLFNFIAWSEQE